MSRTSGRNLQLAAKPHFHQSRHCRGIKRLPTSIRAITVAELGRELAHEINNPLQALTNLLYLMKSSASEAQTTLLLEEAESHVARVSAAVLKAASV